MDAVWDAAHQFARGGQLGVPSRQLVWGRGFDDAPLGQQPVQGWEVGVEDGGLGAAERRVRVRKGRDGSFNPVPLLSPLIPDVRIQGRLGRPVRRGPDLIRFLEWRGGRGVRERENGREGRHLLSPSLVSSSPASTR